MIADSCRDYNGRIVPNREMYQPGSDPCESCECLNGQKGMCAQVACDEPPCRNYRLIPGTCCGFECLGEEIDTVEIDLHGIFHNLDACIFLVKRFERGEPKCISHCLKSFVQITK